MRIRPTELGLKGVLLLCALDVAFLATSYSNLFFLLLVFCGVLGCLGLFWTVRNVRTVDVQLLALPAAAAEQPRPLQLGVQARPGRRAFDVAIQLTTDAACSEVAHVPELHADTVVAATLAPQARGVQRVLGLQLVSRFPFGLFQVTRKVPLDGELVTFPKPLPLDQVHARGGAGDPEADALRFALQGQRSHAIAGLRPFRSGDPTTDIHWKATARRGQPIVKEREHDAGDTLELLLDRRCAPAELERALSLATTLLQEAVAAERPVQLRSQDFCATIDRGHRAAAPMLRWLAGTTCLPVEAAPPPRGPAHSIRLPLPNPAEVHRA